MPDISVADPHHFGKLDPGIRIRNKMSRICNTGTNICCLVLSLQAFPDEEDEPAAELLDVEQGEVYANLCSLFPHLDPAFLNILLPLSCLCRCSLMRRMSRLPSC